MAKKVNGGKAKKVNGGKANSLKLETQRVQQEFTAYQDFISVLGLCSAAKILNEKELDMVFEGQRERLTNLNYSEEVISKVMENVANGLMLLKGAENDPS